jgi:soluble lytic murein transglycosylase-like protein
MFRSLCIASILTVAAVAAAQAQGRHQGPVDANGNLDSLIAKHASTYNVPETLVRRVIKRESRGNPRAISKGNYGLMQIRLGTARAMGYRGGIAGLLDADTNMTYAVKYLAGAYRAAGGNHDRAVRYYAAGYYYVAKRQGLLDTSASNPINAFASAVVTDAAPTLATATAVAQEEVKAEIAADGKKDAASSPAVSSDVMDRFGSNK